MRQAIARSKALFPQVGANYNETTHTWTFPSGAELVFSPVYDVRDAGNHQGNEYTRVYAEEITQYAEPDALMMLKGCLRSSVGAPVGFRANANPGGVGHNWVKARYIEPAPLGWKLTQDEHGLNRVYIPSRLHDNPILLQQNPYYEALIRQTGPKALVDAWLHGDWDIIEGVFFDNWTQKNILPRFEIPSDWIRFMSYDYGSSKPFSIGWWAVVSHETIISGQRLRRGALVRYREWYGAKKDHAGRTIPNEGLKLKLSEVKDGIRERERGEKITYRVADPSIFASDRGPSIAEQLGLGFTPGENKRVPGWSQVFQRISGEDDTPMLFVTDNCVDTIRTLPSMPHDKHNSEDIDTDAEDHAADDVRYACMSRPWARREQPKQPKQVQDYGFRRRQSQPSGWVM